jgi:hypothetical protein
VRVPHSAPVFWKQPVLHMPPALQQPEVSKRLQIQYIKLKLTNNRTSVLPKHIYV